MTCPEWRKRVVMRHLAACSVCQTEWQAVQAIWQAAARPNAALPAVPDALRERIFAALPIAPLAPERKRIMPAVFVRPLVGASVGIAAAAAVFGVGLVYGPALVFHAPRAVAFQDVENAMAGIQNAEWTTTATIMLPPSSRKNLQKTLPSPSFTQKKESENFMQASPPRLAIREPAYPTGEQGDGRSKTTVYSGKYILSFGEGGRSYHKYDVQTLNRGNLQTTEEMVRRAVLFPREELKTVPPNKEEKSPLNQRVLSTVEQSSWVSTPDTLRRKAVVRLQNRTTFHYPVSKYRKTATEQIEENTVWVAPDTYRIVRREAHILPYREDSADVKIVFDNYRYNVALPPGIFEVPIPPVGRPFVFHNYAAREMNQWKPSPADTAKIKATLQQAARLWNAKQGNELFQNWDFGFNSTWAEMSGGDRETPTQIAEEKRHWKTRAEKGIPYQSWELRNLTVASQMTGGIYVREKENEPFPPTGRPVNYSATCDVLAVLKPGTKPVPCSMTATFRRVGGNFRITYLNMYDHEMGVGNGIAWRPKPSKNQ